MSNIITVFLDDKDLPLTYDLNLMDDFTKKQIYNNFSSNKTLSTSLTLHNEKGPAYIADYEKCYFINGWLHREDGPAYITIANGILSNDKTFWLRHDLYTEIKFAKKTNHLICNLCNKFCKQECFA